MKLKTRALVIALAIGASLAGCVVEDRDPDTTVVDPPDNTTIIKEDKPDIVVNPPATGGTTG